MPLPTLLFAGGHSHFIQHTAAAFNTTPFYAHACLVPGHVPGKVARFKEHGLWALEEDAYYERGNYLAYENTVQTFIRLVEAGAGRVRPHFGWDASLFFFPFHSLRGLCGDRDQDRALRAVALAACARTAPASVCRFRDAS